MAELHLVTGYKGTAHVTSADQGGLNAMIFGTNDYVLTKGKRFEAQIISNNAVRIYDGALVMNGRYVCLDSGTYLDAIISNGMTGMRRNDIIAVRYEMNRSTGIELVSLIVAEGTPTSGTPTDASVTYPDSILNGATVHDMPLYRVRLNGLTIEGVEPIFQVLAPMSDFHHGFYKQNMLINGDFNCNQRGNKSYDRSGEVGYTVDMWRGFNVMVDVLTEGIKLTGTSATAQGYLTQFIQLGKLKTTTYTISAMVDDKICTFTVTPGGTAKEQNFGTFKISALTTSTWDNDLGDYNNKLKVNICPIGTSSITIKYVDVFEGTVAYPHVKEDPATALMRCRRYIQKNGCVVSPLFSATSNGKTHYDVCIMFEGMMRKPEVTSCTWIYADMTGTNVNGNTISDCQVALSTATFKVSDSTPMASVGHGMRVIYIVSCEHNPKGD